MKKETPLASVSEENKEKTPDDKAVFGTNVLSENVSRETILSGTKFKDLYSLFRKEQKLGIFDSLYNAVYLCCRNNYENSEIDVKSKYKSVHLHPKGWSGDKNKLHRYNIWACLMVILEIFAGIVKFFGKFKRKILQVLKKIKNIPIHMDNSMRTARVLGKFSKNVLLPLVSLAVLALTVAVITTTERKETGVGVYINNKYVGTTDDVAGILATKRAYEAELSEKFGTPVVLDCTLNFKPEKLSQNESIITGNTQIFSHYLETFTEIGYGLYIDNNLTAVSPVEKWLDDAISNLLSKNTGPSSTRYNEKVVVNNNITIRADRYPKSFFLTKEQIMKIFSVDLTESESTLNEYNETKSGSLTDLGVQPDENSKNAISLSYVTQKSETERIIISQSVEYIQDNTLLKGYKRLVSPGEDGIKVVHYNCTYENGKLIKQEIISEETVKQPTTRIVRIGTREPVGDEEELIPTGTYKYPYRGTISSYFGWRRVFGQNNFHQGLDIYGPRGSSVTASDAGEVIEVGYTSGYGNYCIIRHTDEICTRYAHCDKIDVEVGDLVGQGFHIGVMGDTGRVTGVHVHFEVIKNGSTVDPLEYIEDEPLPRNFG